MAKIGLIRPIFLCFCVAAFALSLPSPNTFTFVSYLNVPGFVLVVICTFIALAISRPWLEVVTTLRAIPHLLRHQSYSSDSEVNQILCIASHYRRGHLRRAEFEISRLDNDFLRSGMQKVIDGATIKEIHKLLVHHKTALIARELDELTLLRTAAGFSIVVGVLGAVVMLIHGLSNLVYFNVTTITNATTYAFATLLYGLIISYLLINPLIIKKQRHMQHLAMHLHMLTEAINLIHQRQHPLIVKDLLEALTASAFNRTVNHQFEPASAFVVDSLIGTTTLTGKLFKYR